MFNVDDCICSWKHCTRSSVSRRTGAGRGSSRGPVSLRFRRMSSSRNLSSNTCLRQRRRPRHWRSSRNRCRFFPSAARHHVIGVADFDKAHTMRVDQISRCVRAGARRDNRNRCSGRRPLPPVAVVHRFAIRPSTMVPPEVLLPPVAIPPLAVPPAVAVPPVRVMPPVACGAGRDGLGPSVGSGNPRSRQHPRERAPPVATIPPVPAARRWLRYRRFRSCAASAVVSNHLRRLRRHWPRYRRFHPVAPVASEPAVPLAPPVETLPADEKVPPSEAESSRRHCRAPSHPATVGATGGGASGVELNGRTRELHAKVQEEAAMARILHGAEDCRMVPLRAGGCSPSILLYQFAPRGNRSTTTRGSSSST